jgi:hypothetical protein
MTMILDGTLGITATGSLTGLTTAITPAQGGTGLASPGSNGNLLTSNGTAWVSSAPAASGGMTLLGTITTTTGNSVSLGSLTLTNYKELSLVAQGVATSAGNTYINISSDNSYAATPLSPWGYISTTAVRSGIATINLVTGAYVSTIGPHTDGYDATNAGGLTSAAVTTASTIIYFRLGGVLTFTAGSILVYGVV